MRGMPGSRSGPPETRRGRRGPRDAGAARSGGAASPAGSGTLVLGTTVSARAAAWIGGAAACSAGTIALLLLAAARARNGTWGFPLDDSWIHLCFARNLAELGSYSYFRDQLVTSGSTSPLYTLLLAAAFRLVPDEFLVSYALGILFWGLSALVAWRLARREFADHPWLALGAAAVLALQPRLALLAVSGMETSLFAFLVLAAILLYRARRGPALGIALGLALWCRPDALILWLALACDHGLGRLAARRATPDGGAPASSSRFVWTGFAVAAAFAVAYGAFNHALSGELLPNTFRAKLAFYGGASRLVFFRQDVAGLFLARELLPASVFFVAGAAHALRSSLRRVHVLSTLHLLLVCGFVGTYALELPYAHRFGRYLVPVLPSFVFVATTGLGVVAAVLARLTGKRAAARGLVLVSIAAWLAVSLASLREHAADYARWCAYHEARHVAAGRWIDAQAPRDAVVATHDIGAIAFYGKRRIVDMAGLVTPELIPRAGEEGFEARLEAYLLRAGTTHVAVLTSWLEMVNSRPLFVPTEEPEVLEVHAFGPGRSHLQPHAVSERNRRAMELLLERRDLPSGLALLEESLRRDPASSQTLTYLGVAHELMGRPDAATRDYERALALFPESVDALFGLARVHASLGRVPEALAGARRCLELSPGFEPARRMVAELGSPAPR